MPGPGRPYLNPKLGKMKKHVSLWMHESLYKQQLTEAKQAGMDERSLMRLKLAKVHKKKGGK